MAIGFLFTVGVGVGVGIGVGVTVAVGVGVSASSLLFEDEFPQAIKLLVIKLSNSSFEYFLYFILFPFL